MQKTIKKTRAQSRTHAAASRKKPDMLKPIERRNGWMEENRERLAAALESLGDGIVVTGTDGTICYVNPAFERLTGFADEEIVGKLGQLFAADENSERLFRDADKTLKEGKVWIGPFSVRKKDGSFFEAEVAIAPLSDLSDKPTNRVIAVRDVTDRKRVEQALQARMRLQEAMAAISTDFAVLSPQDIDKGIAHALQKVGEFAGADSAYVLLFSENGAKVGCVHEWCAQGIESQIDGLQQLFFQNSPWWTTRLSQFDSIHIPWVAELPPEASAERELLQAHGIQSLLAVSVVHRESLIGLLGIHSAPRVRIQSGETLELLRMVANLIADALEHKLSAESLRESEERYRCLADASLEGIVIHDGDRVLDVNSTCAAMLGYTTSELLGRSGLDFIAPESRQRVAEKIRTKCEEPYLATALRKDGSTFPIEICACRIPYKGKIVRVVAFRDMTEQKRTEQTIRESEKRLRDLANLLPQTVFETDLVGNVIFTNCCGLETFGYTAEDFEKGLNIVSLFLPEDVKRIEETRERMLQGEEFEGDDYTALRKDGSRFPVTIYSSIILQGGKPTGFRGIVIDNTRQEQARDELRESEEKYRDLVENIQDVIYSMDWTGIVTYMSPAVEAATGYKPSEIIGHHFTEFILRDDWPLLAGKMHHLLSGGPSEPHEYRFVTRDGEIRWMLTSSRPIMVENQVAGLHGILADITERKRAEAALREFAEKRKELEHIVNQSPAIAFLWKAAEGWPVEYVSDNIRQFGYSPEDLCSGRIPYASIVYPDDLERVAAEVTEYSRDKDCKGFTQEYRIRTQNGEIRWLDDKTWIRRNEKGEITHYQGIILDVTERKRVEKALQESEARFQDIALSTSDWIWEVDAEGVYTYCSGKVEEILGYAPQEMIGKTPFAFMPSEEAERIARQFQKIADARASIVDIENWDLHKDGRLVCLLTNGIPVLDVHGNLTGYRGADKDITERKQAEIELQASREWLKEAQAIGKIGNWELDLVTGGVLWSDQACRLYECEPGTEPPALDGEFEAFCPEDIHLLRDAMRRAAEQGETSEMDLRVTLPSGKHAWHHGIIQPVQDEHGKVVRIVGTVQDITERKQTEESLRTGKVHLLNAIRIAKLGNWEYDVLKDLFTFSDEFYALFRTTAEQVGGFTMSSARYAELFVHPEDRAVVADEVRKAIEATDPNYSRQLEHRIVYTDGKVGHIAVRFQIVKDPEGRTVRTYGMNQDITERKQAETALRESEERLRILFGNLTIGIYRTTPDGQILIANPALVKLLGYSSFDELSTRNLEKGGFHPTYPRSEFKKRIERDGEIRGLESAWTRDDGTTIYVRETARAILGEDGKILYYEGTVEDITEHKKNEESLEFERKQLLSIFDGMDESVYVIDPATHEILYTNSSLERAFGRKLVGSICHRVFRNSDTPCENCAYPKLIENKGRPLKWELHNSARNRDSAITSQLIRWPDGREVLLELAADITEKKRAELALRENEEKYRDLVENISEMVYAVDMHGVITYVSPVIETLTEQEPSEAIGRNFADFIHPEDRQYMIERLQRVLRGEPRQSSEFRIMTKSGAVRWVQTSSRPIVHDDQVLGVQGVLIDITERKRVEEALRESEERLRILFDNLTIGVYRTTPEGRIMAANPAFVKMLGYSAFNELAARNLDDEAVYLAYPRDQFKALMERDGEIRGLEAVWKRRDGSFRFVRENARAAQGKDGEILYYEGTAEDITERKQAEQALRLTQFSIESIVDAALWMGPDAHFVYANDAACRMLGYSRQELLSMTAHDINPAHPPEVWPDHWRELKERRSFTFEACMRKKDGQGLSVEITPNYLEFEGKEYNCAFVRDITERKQIEQALRRSEEKYRTLIEQQGEGIVIADPDERFMFCNPAAEEIFGVPRGTLVGRNFEEFVGLQTLDLLRAQTEKRREGEKSAYEIEIIRPSGEKRHIVILATPWLGENDQFAGAWGILRDETERKRAETELRFRVELENLISMISTDFINLDSSEIDHGINRALQRIGEFTGADRSYVFLLSEDGTVANNTHEWCAEGIEPQIDNMKRMSADDFPWWAERMLAFEDIYIPRVAALPEEAASEKAMLEAQEIKSLVVIPMVYRESLLGFVGFDFVREERTWIQDVEASLRILRMAGDAIANAIEHKQTERALRESEAQYRSLIENSNDAIYLLVDGKFQIINRRFSEMFAVTPEEVRDPSFNFLQMVAPRSQPLIEERMRMAQRGQTPPSRYEFVALTQDGKEIEVETSVTRIPFHGGTATQGILRDIADRKRLEAQLRQAQKMEAIGTLAGGIAHDFNNILMAMLGYTEMAKIDLPEGTGARGDMEEVLKAGRRAKDLVRQILAFSRQIDQERQPAQLHHVIKEALKLLRASFPATVEIRQNISTDCGTVMADPTQIHQVLMNLCSNAHHSMRDKGGILEVELKSFDVDANLAVLVPNLREGPYVRLTVSDTGHGMDRATMERIFEPFFTTKAVGEGTGMGLATVHGIVMSHGGAITVYSEPDKGTAFRIYLPRLEAVTPEATAQVEPILTGKEHILFVDDEEPLTRLGKQMLEHLGYRVTARTSSVEALEAFRSNPNKFDLIISDQTMPNFTGMELAEEMMRIRPDIPIILATGFSETMSPEKAKQSGIREYIMKPIAARELAKVIRQVLDEAKTEA